ncbi:MAG: NAD-dependent epimerase/dehydratase [Comamonadaceae bacterium]|nr:MAG: NAD-dependent epimerase/dehydratase [Comamonadaceae bacterium]
MSYLVTGASGLVGQQVCRRLLHDGVKVRMAVRTPLSDFKEGQQTLIGSMDGSTDWTQALADVHVVIHLAARVHVMHDTTDKPLDEFRRVNVLGACHLARQAAAAKVKRFIFISSVKVNGEQTQAGHAFTEQDEPDPQDAYALSKHEAEQGLRQIALETGMEVIIIRPPLVYGPGVKANFAALIRVVQKGWPLPLGAIHNQRSLIALDNLVDFILTCASHPQAANETFLICDGHDVSTTELVRGLALAAGKHGWLIPVPCGLLLWSGWVLGREEAVKRLCGNLQIDHTKARQRLGWKPPVTVEEGLRRAVQDNFSA